MKTELYRTCPESGLQFHKPAERLMRANAVVAVVMLLIGGLSAVGVTLTRWPAIHLLPADKFNVILTGTKEEGAAVRGKLFSDNPDVTDLSGKLDLNELINFRI